MAPALSGRSAGSVSADLTTSILVAGLAPRCCYRSMRLAVRAGAGDLDHRQFRRKAGGARRGVEALRDRGGRNLADRAAMFADQERHHRRGVMVMRAGEIGVAAFDAVDEAVFHQEIERAIHRDRRRPRHRFGEFVDHLIGAERPVAGQQRLQHLAADRREFLRPPLADPLRHAASRPRCSGRDHGRGPERSVWRAVIAAMM